MALPIRFYVGLQAETTIPGSVNVQFYGTYQLAVIISHIEWTYRKVKPLTIDFAMHVSWQAVSA